MRRAHERFEFLRVGRGVLQFQESLIEGRRMRTHLLPEQVHDREIDAHRILVRNS